MKLPVAFGLRKLSHEEVFVHFFELPTCRQRSSHVILFPLLSLTHHIMAACYRTFFLVGLTGSSLFFFSSRSLHLPFAYVGAQKLN